MLFLNLGLLAGIAFLAFGGVRMTMIVIGVFFTALLAYLRRHPILLKPGVPRRA